MTINVSPIAVNTYDSIFEDITDDILIIPSHLTADPSAGNDQLSASSTLASAPQFEITGALIGTGANIGWFTGVAAGTTRIQVAGDAAIDTMMRTDTLAENEALLISFYVNIPGAGLAATSGIMAYGRGIGANPGIYININAAEKPTLSIAENGGTDISTGVADAITAGTTQHILGVVQKTALGFQTHLYQAGALTKSSTDTAGTGYGPIATSGLNIYSNCNAIGTILSPMETDLQVSDIIIARTSGDKTSHFAELALRQSRVRTSLVRKWTDVL